MRFLLIVLENHRSGMNVLRKYLLESARHYSVHQDEDEPISWIHYTLGGLTSMSWTIFTCIHTVFPTTNCRLITKHVHYWYIPKARPYLLRHQVWCMYTTKAIMRANISPTNPSHREQGFRARQWYEEIRILLYVRTPYILFIHPPWHPTICTVIHTHSIVKPAHPRFPEIPQYVPFSTQVLI